MPDKPIYERSKHAPPKESDGRVGPWTQEELLRMDSRFVERMERATVRVR